MQVLALVALWVAVGWVAVHEIRDDSAESVCDTCGRGATVEERDPVAR